MDGKQCLFGVTAVVGFACLISFIVHTTSSFEDSKRRQEAEVQLAEFATEKARYEQPHVIVIDVQQFIELRKKQLPINKVVEQREVAETGFASMWLGGGEEELPELIIEYGTLAETLSVD